MIHEATNTEKWKARCKDCGAEFTEVYPDGLDGQESFSDPEDPKLCDCDSQYTLTVRVG